VAADIFFLDRLALTYLQVPIAEEDRLEVQASEDGVLQSTGFSAPPAVYDVTDPSAPVRFTMEAGRDVYPIPVSSGHQYSIVGPKGYLRPEAIQPAVLDPDLRSPDFSADYLAVGPPDLLEPLAPLLEHRRSQGLAATPVPIQAIYDQFGSGLPEPAAVQAFLKYAAANWETPPAYLLLVGDGTYDPAGYQASESANRVPSFFLFTAYGGETMSDLAFVQLDEDQYPDMAVGRMPAQQPEQIELLVEKVIRFENTQLESPWNNRILAIADGQSPTFTTDAEQFTAHFPSAFEPVIYSPAAGSLDAASEIQQFLEQGVFIMSYFGHGSITQLGKDGLFTNEDAANLQNESHLTIMVNVTCLAGLFTHPTAPSLSEIMLWNPEGGAVAALGATSLTLPEDQQFLTRAFAEVLVEQPGARLGTVLQAAQGRLPVDRSGVLEVLNTFLLFGDPALKLPAP
jgi:hypothetical protein